MEKKSIKITRMAYSTSTLLFWWSVNCVKVLTMYTYYMPAFDVHELIVTKNQNNDHCWPTQFNMFLFLFKTWCFSMGFVVFFLHSVTQKHLKNLLYYFHWNISNVWFFIIIKLKYFWFKQVIRLMLKRENETYLISIQKKCLKF